MSEFDFSEKTLGKSSKEPENFVKISAALQILLDQRQTFMTVSNPALERDVAKRRTFAIISHPDAGKTTLTEKLLLFGGAIQMAGAVKGRKANRHATSDWMEVEKQRGISVTSSVMQFNYKDHVVNLLDTPGPKTFPKIRIEFSRRWMLQ